MIGYTFRKMKIILILISLNFYLFGQTHYVSKTGTSIPPYSSWETAATSIQDAINISQPNDIVLIANGLYQESLRITKSLTISGISRDSVIVDSLPQRDTVLLVAQNSTIQKLTLKGAGSMADVSIGILALCDSINIDNIKIENCREGVVSITSCIIKNSIISNSHFCVAMGDWSMSHYLIITDCIFKPAIGGFGIKASPYNFISVERCLFKPNIVNGMRDALTAASEINILKFRNNIVLGSKLYGVNLSESLSDSVIIENNSFINLEGEDDYGKAIFVRWPQNIKVHNNIFADARAGIDIIPLDITNIDIDYNMYWKVSSQAPLWYGQSDLIDVYPEFVEDYSDFNLSYDIHLDIHSPAIDAGSPDILDKDGSRSDIGAYGGPGGETYEYIDNPPSIVQNFSLLYSEENQSVTASWDSLYASDIKYYRLYRDTLNLSVINEDALIATPSTATFVDITINPPARYYYYVLAEDSSGQRSSWRSKILAINVTGIKGNGKQDYGYNLNQNYPNPFNPKTTIEYQLEKESQVSLEVLDIKGERVDILVDGIQNAGSYSITFDGSNLASGVYLYRLHVKDKKGKTIYLQGNKMLLLK